MRNTIYILLIAGLWLREFGFNWWVAGGAMAFILILGLLVQMADEQQEELNEVLKEYYLHESKDKDTGEA